ncbi:hypothetical protein [Agriterribacter humi]|uniref:hypothetical protein n=1 Tax=Agriterribacter humi TaxID=1104781 RepID=UPI0012643932|nr:hypothetical protein [Agriterribacter humi]
MLNSKNGLLIIYVILCIGCTSNKTKTTNAEKVKNGSIFLDHNLVNLFLGIEITGDSSNIVSKIIASLNCSQYEVAGKLLVSNYSCDTVYHSGFWGLQNTNQLDNIGSYLFFRYESFLNNLPQEQQELMIVGSLIHKPQILNAIQELEYSYVKNSNNHDSLSATHIIHQAKKLMNGSQKRIRRIEFILANSLFDVGDINGGLIVFKKLIEENYYALPSFKRIINTLRNAADSAQLEQYIDQFKNRFPDEYLVQQINHNNSSTADIVAATHEFAVKNNQRDFILAKTILARHYLNNKNYLEADSIINEYFKNFKEFTANDFLVKYERGVFFDLQMRRFYMQNKFDRLCEYALISLRENPVIEIKNEKDFKNYIKFLYKKYTNKNSDGFDDFFNSHFEDCR